MEEKILIKNRHCTKMLLILLLAISIILSVVSLIPTWIDASQYDQLCYETYTEHQAEDRCADKMCKYCKHVDTYSSSFAYLVDESLHSAIFLIAFSSTVFLSIVIFLWSQSYSLVVTDKRICGTTWWKLKQIDLPLDSVTSISRGAILKSVVVSTPSGTIRFCFVKNNKDIYNVLANLLLLRQNNNTSV